MTVGDIRSKVASWLEYAALRLVVLLLGSLGVDRASALMGWLWQRFAPLNPRHRRSDRHMAYAMPELTAAERASILSAMWNNLGRTFAEGLLLPKIVAEPGRIDIDPSLAQAIKDCGNKGIVFCSLHQGNWELLAVASEKVGQPVAGIYRPLRNPYSEAYIRSLREAVYSAGLMTAGGASALKLRSIARHGAAIAMMTDLPDGTGINGPFFDQVSPLSKLPVTFARHLGLPLLVARCRRTEGAHFVAEGMRIDIARTDDADADIAEATFALHAVFESWIRSDPGQWMWAIRKWGGEVGGR